MGKAIGGRALIVFVALGSVVAVGACRSQAPAEPAGVNAEPGSGSEPSPDAAPSNAGPDAAPSNAGPDAAPSNAGPDAGSFDAGPDAGSFDAGPAIDGGPDAGPCANTYTDISAGQSGIGGISPSALIDAANSKLLVVTQHSGSPALFRCNLDGTSCTNKDISAGQGAGSGNSASAIIDVANSKLLVVTENGDNASRAALFRCNLDGTSCTYKDISAGQGFNSGVSPSAVIDAANSKLLVVTQDFETSGLPALFRCNLDGTSCTYKDISAGQGAGTGFFPSAVIDAVNGKLLVATRHGSNGSNDGKPALFRCNLDGTSCTYTDISAGQGVFSGDVPSALIDAKTGKLLVVTRNWSNSSNPALFRCNLDGTSCTYTDISAGQVASTGINPSAVIDTVGGKLLVVTDNGANSDRPALFNICLP